MGSDATTYLSTSMMIASGIQILLREKLIQAPRQQDNQTTLIFVPFKIRNVGLKKRRK
jgi:hypothetical protein